MLFPGSDAVSGHAVVHATIILPICLEFLRLAAIAAYAAGMARCFERVFTVDGDDEVWLEVRLR